MGCTTSQDLSYQELHYSIPGLLVENDDRELFFSMCKIDRETSISGVLRPSPTQLFYVVVSGEVNVLLSAPNVQSRVVQTFTAGETIHFFNSPIQCSSSSYMPLRVPEYCISNSDIKLSLQLRRTSTASSQVIGMHRKRYEEFSMKAVSNIHAITSFVNMSMVDLFLNSPLFLSMTMEQVSMTINYQFNVVSFLSNSLLPTLLIYI